jgi:hypothetical protein
VERKWYQENWAIISLLWLFFPVGLYLMWRHAKWPQRNKWIVSAAIALLVVVVVIASAFAEESDEADSASGTISESTETPPIPTHLSPTPRPTPAATPTEQQGFSVLEITDVSASGSSVRIAGRTDLPDGAVVVVTFDVWGRADSDVYIGVDDEAEVSDGRFELTLEVPQRDEFKAGPYELSVLFTPRGQDDEVLAIVGSDGERLLGPLVQEVLNFRTIELVQQVAIDLAVSPPAYVFQEPSEFPPDSPERALAEYVAAWRDEDWARMVSYAQKTWVDAESDPAATLEAMYDFRALKGFEVKEITRISEVTSDITFAVSYEAIPNQIDRKEITARVIRETAPYNPSPQGAWGVNPLSTLREDDVD